MPPSVPPPPPPPYHVASPDPATSVPLWTNAESSSAVVTSGPRRVGGRVGWIVGIVALVGVVAAGLATMLGSGSGSDSGEDAVRRLAEAAASEDILAAAQVLPPSEVGSAPELYDLIIKVMQKNDGLGPAGKPLAGVDITVDGLELSAQPMGDRVTKVSIVSGTFGANVDADGLDPKIREGLPDSETMQNQSESISVAEIREQMATESSLNDVEPIDDLFLMTIKIGDSWYVSYQYTMLEYMRLALGGDPIEFGPRVSGDGVSQPSDLVNLLVAELDAIDSERIATMIENSASAVDGTDVMGSGWINPIEVQAYVDYLPFVENLDTLVEDMMGMSIAESGREAEFDSSFEDSIQEAADMVRKLDIDVSASAETSERELSNGRRAVIVSSMTVTVTIRGEVEDEIVDIEGTFAIENGSCFSAEFTYRDSDGQRVLDGDEACAEIFDGTNFDGFFVVAVQDNGNWYFSPIETVVEYARYALEAELAR